MPGLLRGVARTAAVVGTATAVNGRVQRRQAAKYADKDAATAAQRDAAYQQDVYQQAPPQQQYAPPPQQYAPPAPAPADSTSDMLDQLKQLGELKTAGVLTEEEFAAQKAKILGA